MVGRVLGVEERAVGVGVDDVEIVFVMMNVGKNSVEEGGGGGVCLVGSAISGV